MNIAIAGGKGLLGQAITERLVAGGHRVLVLTRGRGSTARPWASERTAHTWVPDGTAGAWAEALDGAHAILNLAGESIAEGRWTEARKRAILDSRVHSTRSLVTAIRELSRPPEVFVSASGQGYYGDRGDEELTEASAPGNDFLASVCREWEAEARAAESRTRVVLLRNGIVLSAEGGALPRMATPFRLFAGGPLGSGRQFMSWIHIDDWVGVVRHALASRQCSGPLNLGSPRPVRNVEFSAALGRALHRPSLLPAPAFALRLAVGEMATPLLLASTRMVPAAVLAAGYRFEFEEAADALADLLA